MKRLFVLLVIPFCIVTCSQSPENKSTGENEKIVSQVKIGDLTINSIENFMDKNSDYWVKGYERIYYLNNDSSEIFTSSVKLQSSSLMLQQENIEQKTIFLNVNSSYDKKEVLGRIEMQLNEQLGESEDITIGLSPEPNVKQWMYKSYRIQMGKDMMGASIMITKQKETPDF